MAKRALNLQRLLPSRYRDKTIDSFIENTIDQQLTRDDTSLLYGYVGSEEQRSSSDLYLTELELERKINQLQAVYDVTLGQERSTLAWSDFLQRLITLGVDQAYLADWLTLDAHNFAPPATIDKLINYEEYLWVGPWVQEQPLLQFGDMGLAPVADIAIAANTSGNLTLDPEYYLIQRGALSSYVPVAPYPGVSTWSAWSIMNLWVHKEEARAFAIANPSVSLSSLASAQRPIIELDVKFKLTAFVDGSGAPADSGTSSPQVKVRKNQPPQFDLYYHTGEHAKLTSMMFYLEENQQSIVDPVIGRRLTRQATSDDLSFAHGFIEPTSGRLLWAKRYNGSSFELNTIWSLSTSQIEPTYSKYDEVGTVINVDKFTNWRNYYWTGTVGTSLPSWNLTGLAEYSVIEQGGASGWSVHNYWKHVSELENTALPLYHRATKPIIEFNKSLEAELLIAKNTFNELPRFKQYRFNDTTNSYDQIPDIANLRENDSFTEGVIFARFNELPIVLQQVIDGTAEVAQRLTFTVNGERFVCSSASGEFAIQNGPTLYGFSPRVLVTGNVGDGEISGLTASVDAVAQAITLTATSPTTFSVVNSQGFSFAAATVGVAYSLDWLAPGDVTFTILAGATPFAVGDSFVLEVKSILFNQVNFYSKLGETYRTFSTASGITTDITTSQKVAGTPLSGDGVWEVPKPFSQNINNETRTVISEGDLIDHLSSILNAQTGFEGSAIGSNNSRFLTIAPEKGGIIKQYESRLPLLLGLLAQQDFTARDLLELSSKSYDQMLNSVREFVEVELVNMLEEVNVPGGTVTLSQELIDKAIAYIEQKKSSELEVDRPFYLSTMPIKALALTLPYLGLSSAVQPAEELDLELNIPSLVHHDGHKSPLASVDYDVLKRIVLRQVKRSNGQTTAGYIGGPNAPTKPFAKQLWLDLSSSTLNIYDVVTDEGILPDSANIGQFAYNRADGSTWQWNGSWVFLGSSESVQENPWRQVDLTATLRGLLLAIENVLYEQVPPVGPFLGSLSADPLYDLSMKREFEGFAAAQGVDPYSVDYDASNPFSWSYKGTLYPGTSDPATWQQLYFEVYGTSRPDLQPWISTGYPSEAAFIADAVAGLYLPPLTTAFDISQWPALATWVSSLQVGLSKPAALAVDPATGSLLSPFAFGHPQQLLAVAPPTPTLSYVYGDGGPVELVWKRSTAFRTARQVSLFRVNPLAFVTDCWGESFISTNGGYTLLDKTGLKTGIFCQVHGEIEVERNITAIASLVAPPLADTEYVFEVTAGAVFSVKIDSDFVGFSPISSTYSDSVIDFTATIPVRGLNIGDKFIVSVDTLGVVTLESLPISYKLLTGYGQLFSQAVRLLGADESISRSTALLRDWKMSLAYNSNKIIDRSLALEINNTQLSSSSYELLLKERFLASSAWYSSLKVTLLRIGSSERKNGLVIPAIGPSGRRGDDWLFSVETFTPGRTRIEWNEPTSSRNTFFALNAKRTQDEWTRAAPSLVASSTNSPVTITGLQATVDFIFGVASRYATQGFVVDGELELPIDSSTNRPRDWQLLVENFIDQQFGGVQAGSSFLFDPLSEKMLFKPATGLMSKLEAIKSTTSVYSTVYGRTGKPIENSRVFRTAELTTIVPPEPIYAAKLTTSNFEHTLALEDDTGSLQLFDPFLGQAAPRIFLTGRYSFNNWRPESGSRFLTSGSFLPNIEGSIQDLSKLYDSSTEVLDNAGTQRARALLGYTSKEYYRSRGAPELTQFRFWQGALKAKGTNRAIEAFVNAKQYRTAVVDEYWAYKVAEYGDNRSTLDVEIKIEPDDTYAERTNLLFLEDDEVQKIDEHGNVIDIDYYDVSGYDVPPYDTEFLTIPSYSALYTASQLDIMEPVNFGFATLITPTDEARWFRYDELGSIQYLEAELYTVVNIVPDRLDRCYTIIDPKTGKPVNADCFELVDTVLLTSSDAYDVLPYDTVGYGDEANAIYRETGELILGSSPPQYTPPKFRRLNHAVIKLDDPILLGRSIAVRCYAPAIKKFSPSKMLTYTKIADQKLTDEIVWWDPKRGSHSQHAHSLVTLQSDRDPAVYNQALARDRSSDKARPWGKNQVGKVWWDTTLAEWLPYSDTKIRPLFADRKSAWGALKDFGKIDLYEWIESSVPPLEYDTLSDSQRMGSTVGFINKISRTRVWNARPVAWLFTNDPQVELWKPRKLGTANLQIDNDSVLWASSGTLPEFAINEKIGSAEFSTLENTVETLSTLHGVWIVRSAAKYKAGSSISVSEPLFLASAVTGSKQIKLSESAFKLANAGVASSAVNLTFELDGTTPYLRATLASSLKSQRVSLTDTPPLANTPIELNFDQLGLVITALVTFGRSDVWPVASATAVQRLTAVFNELTQANITIRLSYEIEALIPLESSTVTLNGTAVTGYNGWVSWIDPTQFELSNDNVAPFNKWKPFVGSWSTLSTVTPAQALDIKARLEAPWENQPYAPIWSAWKKAVPLLLRTTYCTFGQTHNQAIEALQFQALESQAKRACSYINGIKHPIGEGTGITLVNLNTSLYDVPSYDTTPYNGSLPIPTWYLNVDPDLINQGDELVVIVPPVEPSAAQLALDLTSSSADPAILTDWKLDAPCVVTSERSIVGTIGKSTYYFWVKNKLTPPTAKTMSINNAEALLRNHDSYFAVPQLFKFYNQLDARPNRYGLLSVRGLSWTVVLDKRYKIKIKRISSMRDDDVDIRLKPIHAEWQLIRKNQPTRIPFELWSVLVDTLCGETQAGQELPAIAFSDYDSRDNIIPASWGFNTPRVLCPPGIARATISSVIQAPTATKYDPVQQKMVSNPLSYAGFDINLLDTYLSNASEIREFMGAVWKNADPKQINEFFFAVLHDALAYTRELPGLFKTSYISVDDVRTSNLIEDAIL